MTETRQPTLYIPHGGGPCFFMDSLPGRPREIWDGLAAYLTGLQAELPERPAAILVVSAHWEEPRPTVNVCAHPPMLFDYYGFPEHTYRLSYPAPGSPELAARVRALLEGAGIAAAEDAARGFDHGVFVPFLLAFPDAETPVVQLSLKAGLDPAAHLAIGAALAPLRAEGVLIVGSGMSYHNLRHFFAADPAGDAASVAFDDWLDAAATAEPEARMRALCGWEGAPYARHCHPREEHLLPLMVAAGAAEGDRGRRSYNERIVGKAHSGFRFG